MPPTIHKLEDLTNTFKLNNSSTDHVPIIVQLKQKKNGINSEVKTVSKRCMKNFNSNEWIKTLEEIDFSFNQKSGTIEEEAVKLSEKINRALYIRAPIKTFK